MRQIKVDTNGIKGPRDQYASLCVGAGRAGEGLRRDFVSQLGTAAGECGFEYLRFHGIFHDEMGVYAEDEQGNPLYNWQYVDLVYDAILEKGMKPFVEISFMPLALASGTQTVFWWNSNVTPPKDYDKWYALVNRFVRHLEERYGREEVAAWYFEVWNEPNHPAFFSGTEEEYYRLYAVTAKAVKDVWDQYRVGGPATAGSAWIPNFISFCSEQGVPVDFISTHTYGVDGAFDEFGIMELYLRKDPDAIIKDVRAVYEEVQASAMPELEIHYTEWSSSYSSRDPVHDSYIEAPYILHNLKRLEGLVASMSYWTFTDIFEEVGPPPAPFHGGFGLINLQSLKKPAYYAYKFIHELGGTELVNEDPDSWACRDDSGVQLLFWNYTRPEQDDCNRRYFTRRLPSREAESVEIEIVGLQAGRYCMELYRTGFECNDVYTEYLETGETDSLKRETVAELARKTSGKPVVVEEVELGAGEVLRRSIPMRENDVVLVKMNRKQAD